MYTFINVVWEIALLMTHNTVPLQPDFPAKFPLFGEAETAEETRWKPSKPTAQRSHHIRALLQDISLLTFSAASALFVK